MDDPVRLRAAAYDPPSQHHRPTHGGGVMGAVCLGMVMGVWLMLMLGLLAHQAGVLDFDPSRLVVAP
jgi:predicted lipid-binding transport protein (Tim44 family)